VKDLFKNPPPSTHHLTRLPRLKIQCDWWVKKPGRARTPVLKFRAHGRRQWFSINTRFFASRKAPTSAHAWPFTCNEIASFFSTVERLADSSKACRKTKAFDCCWLLCKKHSQLKHAGLRFESKPFLVRSDAATEEQKRLLLFEGSMFRSVQHRNLMSVKHVVLGDDSSPPAVVFPFANGKQRVLALIRLVLVTRF